ncbi:hypothetical protein BASA62_003613 [Batrachochytrium salamandrivorans]|nr:hypothetical protein BASA62_003613 [Batrachochytrium salamandrivorans]
MLFTTVIISTLALVASTSAFTVDRPGHSDPHTGSHGNNEHLGKRQFGMGGFQGQQQGGGNGGFDGSNGGFDGGDGGFDGSDGGFGGDGNLQRRAFPQAGSFGPGQGQGQGSAGSFGAGSWTEQQRKSRWCPWFPGWFPWTTWTAWTAWTARTAWTAWTTWTTWTPWTPRTPRWFWSRPGCPQTLKSIIAMIIGIRSQGPFEGSSLALFSLSHTLPIIAHFQSKYAMHVCTVI